MNTVNRDYKPPFSTRLQLNLHIGSSIQPNGGKKQFNGFLEVFVWEEIRKGSMYWNFALIYRTFVKDCFLEGCSINTNVKLSHRWSIQLVASTLCKCLLSYITFHFNLFLNKRVHWSLTILEVPMRGRAVVKMEAQIMQTLIPVMWKICYSQRSWIASAFSTE